MLGFKENSLKLRFKGTIHINFTAPMSLDNQVQIVSKLDQSHVPDGEYQFKSVVPLILLLHTIQ